MRDMTGVLAVIPARAGSKGLPGKNYLSFNGRPLIEWTISAAKNVDQIESILVTSDDLRVLNLASSLGVIAHKRPSELCGDFIPTSQVVAEALSHYSTFRTVVFLQPTSPLRTSQHIVEALDLFGRHGKTVISVTKVTQHPEWMYSLDPKGQLLPFMTSEEARRQDTQELYVPNGAIYISASDTLSANNYIFSKPGSLPYEMDSDVSIDIDSQTDFYFAEWIMKNSSLSRNIRLRSVE